MLQFRQNCEGVSQVFGHEVAAEPVDDKEWRLLVGQHWLAAVAALQSIKEAADLEGFMAKLVDAATTEPLVELFGSAKGLIPTSDKARLVRRLLELASADYMAAMKAIQDVARALDAGANKA